MIDARFAYFGTPYVARDTLERLVARGFVPAVVITSPDAPKGRGQVLQPSETKAWAAAYGIPVLTPEKIDERAIEEIKSYGCAFAVVVAYGKIFPQALIDAFPSGVLNIHYSLLPKYRGASPVESALLHGETTTGVSIQKMVLALDAGDILTQKEVSIEPNETTKELRPHLVAIGADLLADTLPAFIAGTAAFTPQDHAEATKFGKIDKSEGRLDLADDAIKNWNKYRAYAESPGTHFFVRRAGAEMRIKIVTAALQNGQFVPLRIVPEGKREMDWADFSKND